MSYHFTSGMTHSNLIRLLLLEKTRTIQLGISHLKSLLFYQPNYIVAKGRKSVTDRQGKES